MSPDLIIIILLSLLLSFFFSGIEIAFLSANQLQVELQANQGVRWGKIILPFVKQPSLFISTTLIGNTLALVLFSTAMTYAIDEMTRAFFPAIADDELYIMLVQVTLSTLLILFIAEFLPKSLFLIDPDSALAASAIPFKAVFYILAPITFLVMALSRLIIVHLFKLEYSEKHPVFGLTDLNHYLNDMLMVKHEDAEIELDRKIFYNATQFKAVKVRECMAPRTEIVAISITDDMSRLRQTFIESGHSKIIVYDASIDNIIGYCHSSSLFSKPEKISDILITPIIVTETTMARALMVQFVKERKSLAVVVDEFGGTSGIVSMEDVIEEIFGEIEDEYDAENLVEQKMDEKTYLLSARHEIDYLNDKYGWSLPTGDYETLGGMILSVTEDFPKKEAMIIISPYTFVVQSARENQIEVVKMTIVE